MAMAVANRQSRSNGTGAPGHTSASGGADAGPFEPGALSARIIHPKELGADDIAHWRRLQQAEPSLSSPFFNVEFAQIVGACRDDARIALLEAEGRRVGYFAYHQRPFGLVRPLASPMSDQQGAVDGAAALTPHDLVGPIGAQLIVYANWRAPRASGTDPAWAGVRRLHGNCVIDTKGDGEAYAAAQRKAHRRFYKKIDKGLRELDALGGARLIVNDRSPEALSSALRWKQAQYRRTGLHDLMSVGWIAETLRRVAAEDTPDFAGIVCTLRAGERIVAVDYGMRSHTLLQDWFPSYDPDFSRTRPGFILLAEMARKADEIGVSMIDLGSGHTDYKIYFTEEVWPLAEGVSARGGAASARRAVSDRFYRLSEAWEAQGGMKAAPARLRRRLEHINACEPQLSGRLRALAGLPSALRKR